MAESVAPRAVTLYQMPTDEEERSLNFVQWMVVSALAAVVMGAMASVLAVYLTTLVGLLPMGASAYWVLT